LYILTEVEAISGFDWDSGNRAKCRSHGVSAEEIESLFRGPVMILPEEARSTTETRMKAIGKTAAGRFVFWFSRSGRSRDNGTCGPSAPGTCTGRD
jgi:uncharacterized DUF497 family protein